ncbi:MAG: DUF3810 domain-containing protein [Firmicutes bacterium]|nr:DUF3810 domain-containing protein [Candidatus Colimorpha enterica]
MAENENGLLTEAEEKENITDETGQSDIREESLVKAFRRLCPKVCYAFFALLGLGIIIQVICIISTPFADFWNRYPAAFFRMILAKLTGWFPFSLAECTILTLPIEIVVIVVCAIVLFKKNADKLVKLLSGMLAFVSALFGIFFLNFSPGYRTSTIDKKLCLERSEVSAEELTGAANAVSALLDVLSDGVNFTYGGESVMPYSFSEMNGKLNAAYKKASEKYGFIPDFSSTVKQIANSEFYTYTHISGVYSYFTGESNVNINFPDFVIPYTAAHEMAHQRGIAREDEANFVAFLVCMESDDIYVRYSACLNIYEYLTNSLYSADRDAYKEVVLGTDMRVRYELNAYSEFFEKYEKNVAATVSNAVNDTFLKVQGQKAGSRSYDLVTDLTVALYRADMMPE